MATNPMQRKTRNAFLLGVVVMLIIAAIVVALLYMKIQSQAEEIEEYQYTTTNVYILNQDVESGQILTSSMFTIASVPTSTVPSNATGDISTLLNAYSLGDTDGTTIYQTTDSDGSYYYYYFIDEDGDGTPNSDSEIHKIYESVDGNMQVATTLVDGNTYYYYKSDSSEATKVTFATNSVIAKTGMKANTVITSSLITTASEKITDDLRETEYNVIVLPIDLITGDYVDIRLMLPDGSDYIVVSKKQVTVPLSNGSYVDDTIQMNLSEEEILYLSCAIVESYQIEGAKLYATKYTEAGLQSAAEVTYYPNSTVQSLVESDPNIVDEAIEGIQSSREKISSAINSYGDEDNIADGVEESITSSQEARQEYLQSLTTSTTTTTE